MKLLLDECLPKKLKLSFADHDCLTVSDIGLGGTTNGQLLRKAETLGFNVLITIDRGIPYQQNLAAHTIAIVSLHAPSNRLADLLPLAAECLRAIREIKPGELCIIGS